MALIPAGFGEITMILRTDGITRDLTWSVGIDPNDPDASPEDWSENAYTYLTNVTNGLYAAAGMSSKYRLLGVSGVKQMEEGPIIGQYLSTLVGTATALPVPVNTALLVNKNTALGGRRNRGRNYLPPTFPGEDQIDGAGVVANTYVNLTDTKLEYFYDQLVLGVGQPVLFHQSAPFTPTPITGWSTQNQCGTQRRRMRG